MKGLQNLNYRCVTLTPGHWESQRSRLIETYLSIDADEFLHYFRNKAGISDSAEGLGGWYAGDADTFGQLLGAMARLYLTTGDERLKNRACELADGWGECAEKNTEIIDCNGTYVYDKLMTGFLDMYEYLHYLAAKEYVGELTQSAELRFDQSVAKDGLQVMEGGMIEWYTLPEQILRAYSLFGEEKYIRFAEKWDYSYYWDKIRSGNFDTIGPRHAYSHVNALSSAARFYEVTKNKDYLEVMTKAYDELLAHHTFATGGYGPAECLFTQQEGYLGDSLKANWDNDLVNKQYTNFGNQLVSRDDMWGSCEVSCCSWAVFKLCDYLLRFTGEAKYGDWAEKMLYNGTGGQLPITRDGQVMYYADYFINGGMKTTMDGRLQADGSSFEWQCCTGSFPEDVAEYSNMLYYKNDKDLYVSQYLPSRLICMVGEQTICFDNLSTYPKEKDLRFRINLAQPLDAAIHFRVPSWATGQNSVWVNDRKWNVGAEAGNWIDLSRLWEDGDEILIRFEWILRIERVDQINRHIGALVYGPIVMACNKMTLFNCSMDHPENWLIPIQRDGYSFAFQTRPGCVMPRESLKREFYPYYEIEEHQWYFMYNRFEEKED